MTNLNRKLKRETPRRDWEAKKIIIELEPPDLIRLREKRKRKACEITTSALHDLLVSREAERKRREKRKKKVRK